MNRIFKIIAYLSVAFVISYIANQNSTGFIDKFIENALSILGTLLAINIPSTTFIVSELYKIKKKFNLNLDYNKIVNELRNALIKQIALLMMLIVTFALCDYFKENCYIKTSIISGGFSIAVFFYFMEVIYDLVVAIFIIFKFPPEDK
ncbi:hypothetical protein [Phocaeicola coprocola]|uniref:hypothetical protein n=1 Tax=Phocaeicola coprocola TaxID=310298 RepID=UPI0026706AF5|nr:hypothetical protein [Phocaeicola coprocola]